MKLSGKKLNLQYALLQGTYWMFFCSLYTYATVFLLKRHLQSGEIGIIFALGNILGVGLQPYLGGVADRSKKITLHSMLISFSLLLLLLITSLYFVKVDKIIIGIVYTIILALTQVLQPLVNSISMYYVNHGIRVDFGLGRGVGSLSFAIVSTFLGVWVEDFGINVLLTTGIIFLIALLIVVLTLPIIKDSSHHHKKKHKIESTFAFFRRYKNFTWVLLGIMFLCIFSNMLSNYMIQVVLGLGGHSTQMGNAMAVAAICELPAMWGFTWLISKFSIEKLMNFSAIMYTVKAFLTYFATNIMFLYGAQSLQMLAFAVLTPASVYYVNEVMDDTDKYKGQSYMVATMTIGGVIGSLIGGFMLDVTNFHNMILLGSLLSLIGTVIVIVFITAGKNRKAFSK